MNKKTLLLLILTGVIAVAIVLFLLKSPQDTKKTEEITLKQTDDAVLQHAQNICLGQDLNQIESYMASQAAQPLSEKSWKISIKDSNYFESLKVLMADRVCFLDIMPILATGASTSPILDYQSYRDIFAAHFGATYDKENSDKYTGEYYKFKNNSTQYYAIFNYDKFHSTMSLTITSNPDLYV